MGLEPALAQIMRVHERNMDALGRIPGVICVAFGFKETAGQVVPALAYRVHVREKRVLGELCSDETVPAEMDGFATDVLTGDPGALVPDSGPTLTPGRKITRHVPGELSSSSGTIGLLVRKNAARFILTNDHVVHDNAWLAPDTLDVYSPSRKTISELQCNNPIARLDQQHPKGVNDYIDFEGKKFYVDATIVPIVPGVSGSNIVDGIGRLDQGLRDIATVALSGDHPVELIEVAKRGAETKLTKGKVGAMFRHVKVGNPPQSIVSWEFTVKPDPAASHEYDEKFELADSQSAEDITNFYLNKPLRAQIETHGTRRWLHLTGNTFSVPGDSGSCIVDAQRRIVGLHSGASIFDIQTTESPYWARLPSGDGSAIYIRPVFHAMGLSETDGVIPPGSPSSGPVVEDVEFAVPQPVVHDLEEALSRVPAGQRLLSLARRYGKQLAELVHERRRVLVAWHRAQGPAFAVALLRAQQAGGVLPREINGIALTESLRRMREVLVREGDEDLRTAVLAHGEAIIALAERATSLPELLSMLEKADDRCFRS